MPTNPPPAHSPIVRIDTDGDTANLYIDGILTKHQISEEAIELAWKIMEEALPEGTRAILGRNAFCVFDITPQQAHALAPRLTQVWRADSGYGPAPLIPDPPATLRDALAQERDHRRR